MWNNNDEDYDHVDAGNQERAELGKEVFNTDTRSNFRLNSHFFFIWLWIVSTINVGVYIKSPPKFQNRLILEHWCICISDLNMNFLSLQNYDYFKSHWKRINHLSVHN